MLFPDKWISFCFRLHFCCVPIQHIREMPKLNYLRLKNEKSLFFSIRLVIVNTIEVTNVSKHTWNLLNKSACRLNFISPLQIRLPNCIVYVFDDSDNELLSLDYCDVFSVYLFIYTCHHCYQSYVDTKYLFSSTLSCFAFTLLRLCFAPILKPIQLALANLIYSILWRHAI